MHIHGIEYDSLLNGDGLRAVIWVSGCSHKCPGCHNPQTWDPNSGHWLTDEELNTLYSYLDKDYSAGVTFSGGDPLYPSNREPVFYIMNYLKSAYPSKNIWLYTGYRWEELYSMAYTDNYIQKIMELTDVIVEGPFKKDLADVTYPWAGSINQRAIDVKKTFSRYGSTKTIFLFDGGVYEKPSNVYPAPGCCD